MKTLKDLESYHFEGWTTDTPGSEGIAIETLKEAAIEWIKVIQLDIDAERASIINELVYCDEAYESLEQTRLIEFIKYFFNLSEEDLK